MGCSNLTYHQELKRREFLSVWKRDSLKKTGTQNFFALGEKKTQPVFDVDYYPFGLTFNHWNEAPENLYKYNGKEEQPETDWYDYGARMYDPALGRWITVDPRCEMFYPLSPYNYVLNNPVILTDPDGRAPCPPGIDCSNPLPNMERIRANRASNLGPGTVRSAGTQHHDGHDLYAPIGTRVNSVMNGEVLRVGNSGDYGNFVTIKHTFTLLNEETDVYYEKTYYSFYAHLSDVTVEEGQTVQHGDQIGKTGITGNASSGTNGIDEHLHFEFGTSLRAGDFLDRDGLLSPNDAYDDVSFQSQDPSATNQSDKGVVRFKLNKNGTKASFIFQNFNSAEELGNDSETMNQLQEFINYFLNQ